MKKNVLIVLVGIFISSRVFALDHQPEQEIQLKKSLVASANSNYDSMDVFGIMTFLMQYSDLSKKWNYELVGLSWNEMSEAIYGSPDNVLSKLSYLFTWKEINNSKVLQKLNLNSKSFSGVFDGKYFKNLEYLSCSSNKFNDLILTSNNKLKELNCSNNLINKLNITKNTNLVYLNCSKNLLENLDLTKNYYLKELNCNNNKLNTIDVFKNVNLTVLSCDNNFLNNLDVYRNFNLKELSCSNNQLSNVNVYYNSSLIKLSCAYNKLTTLNVTKNIKLENLLCYNNQIKSIDVTNNENLKELIIYNNRLKDLDLTYNVNLITLYCSSNQLSKIDVSKNSKLRNLYCHYNQLTSLNISNNSNLDLLYAYYNQLKFSTLQGNFLKIKDNYINPQSIIKGGTKGFLELIDLSSEYIINGKKTSFVWLDRATNKKVNIFASNGMFYAGPENIGRTLICYMENDFIPGFKQEYEVTISNSMILTAKNMNASIPEGFKMVGVNEDLLNSFHVSPNPFIDNLKINTSSKVQSADIYNFSGKKVKRIPIINNNIINLEDLIAGAYFIIFKTDQGFVSKKIVKK